MYISRGIFLKRIAQYTFNLENVVSSEVPLHQTKLLSTASHCPCQCQCYPQVNNLLGFTFSLGLTNIQYGLLWHWVWLVPIKPINLLWSTISLQVRQLISVLPPAALNADYSVQATPLTVIECFSPGMTAIQCAAPRGTECHITYCDRLFLSRYVS